MVENIQQQSLRYVYHDYTPTYKEVLGNTKKETTIVYKRATAHCLICREVYLNDLFEINR